MLGFLKKHAQQSESYSGSDSYRYVERLFGVSKGIDIITPYLGISYAEMLVGYANKGKRIRVIMASGQDSNSKSIKYLRSNARGSGGYAAFSAVSFLLFIGSYMYGLPYESMIFLVGFLISVILALRRKGKKAPIYVKYAPGFVHEKIYIGDGEAITGSANLTYNGMHKNTEHIEIIRDANNVAELEKHFNTLWRSSSNI